MYTVMDNRGTPSFVLCALDCVGKAAHVMVSTNGSARWKLCHIYIYSESLLFFSVVIIRDMPALVHDKRAK
jgi:hypothetical protein